MMIIIDRIENNRLIVELPNGQTIDVPCELYPNAAEGDVYRIEKDETETETRSKRINKKMNRLFKD